MGVFAYSGVEEWARVARGACVDAGDTVGEAATRTVGSVVPMGATILFIRTIKPTNQPTTKTVLLHLRVLSLLFMTTIEASLPGK